MMSKQHCNLGIAGYIGGAALVAPSWVADNPLQLLVGAVVCGAGALVPDIDHPNSTITHKLGVVGRPLHMVVRLLGGNHRHGAHSFVPVVLTFLLLSLVSMTPATMGVVVALAFLLIARLVLPFGIGRQRYVVYAGAAVLAYTCSTTPGLLEGRWFAVAAAAGLLLHDVGDMLTKGRVHFFWPITSFAIRSPLAYRTGGVVEVYVVGPALVVATAILCNLYIVQPLIATA